jgi:pilus assembly protein CpaE
VGTQPIAVIPYDAHIFGTAASNGQMIGEVSAKSKPAEVIHELARILSGRQSAGPKINKSGGSALAKLLPMLRKK